MWFNASINENPNYPNSTPAEVQADLDQAAKPITESQVRDRLNENSEGASVAIPLGN